MHIKFTKGHKIFEKAQITAPEKTLHDLNNNVSLLKQII